MPDQRVTIILKRVAITHLTNDARFTGSEACGHALPKRVSVRISMATTDLRHAWKMVEIQLLI